MSTIILTRNHETFRIYYKAVSLGWDNQILQNMSHQICYFILTYIHTYAYNPYIVYHNTQVAQNNDSAIIFEHALY